MKSSYRLLFGPLAALVFVGVLGLGLMVPGYNHVRQTVSEIGEIGSPARLLFAVMLCCVAACIVVFASGIRDVSTHAGRSALAPYIIGCMGLSAAGVGVFAYPHPLHNVFGMSELIGYQAPLVLALTWRPNPSAKTLVTFSWIMSATIWVAIVLNLTSVHRQGALWAYMGPVYGVVQRTLFVAWFLWCAVIGILLYRRSSGIFQKGKAPRLPGDRRRGD